MSNSIMRCLRRSGYHEFFTETSKLRKPSAIRKLQPLLSQPGTISLGGGMPNPQTFPFAKMSLQIKNENSQATTLDIRNLNEALQYSNTQGLPDLLSYLKKLQVKEHSLTTEISDDTSMCITTGSQDALTKCFDMLLEPGDPLLVEEFTYSGSLAYLKPLGMSFHTIKTDEQGIIPASLKDAIELASKNSKPPKVLYTIPNGSNPTGISISERRKEEIYEICSERNIIILEDDPYYFLQFKDRRAKSFFELDVDGRVIRFDSLSKILSSGLRVGFATGPTPLIDRLTLHLQSTSLHSSGISQAVTLNLLEFWEGSSETPFQNLLQHVDTTRDFYLRQRDLCLALAEQYLSKHCTWSVPQAGMFLWVKLKNIEDSQKFVEELVSSKKVLVVPGFEFSPNDEPNAFFRLSYSTANGTQMEEAMKRISLFLENSSPSQ